MTLLSRHFLFPVTLPPVENAKHRIPQCCCECLLQFLECVLAHYYFSYLVSFSWNTIPLSPTGSGASADQPHINIPSRHISVPQHHISVPQRHISATSASHQRTSAEPGAELYLLRDAVHVLFSHGLSVSLSRSVVHLFGTEGGRGAAPRWQLFGYDCHPPPLPPPSHTGG